MGDPEALLAAVLDRPDDDTPRLVFADWLDDHGDPARAAFVRTGVELARTPPWEPLAAACRHRTPDLSDHGPAFRPTLPAFPDGWPVGWGTPPFRRGFGWRVEVGTLAAWDAVAPDLLRAAPVGALVLRAPAATLDDWRRFAAGPWLGRIREVRLAAGSPVEPARALAAGGRATNLAALHFDRADLTGIDLLAADLLAGPLGANLRELSFRLSSPSSLDDLLAVLAAHAGRFDRLGLFTMNLSADPLRRWLAAGGARVLRALDLSGNYTVGSGGVQALAAALAGGWGGEELILDRVGMAEDGVKALAASPGLAGVRLLDLSRNLIARPGAVRALAASPHLVGVRALRLRGSRIGDAGVARLVRGGFWPNLVELDLADNPISDPGAKQFLAVPIPADLTALVLPSRHLGGPTRGALLRHLGPRVVFADG